MDWGWIPFGVALAAIGLRFWGFYALGLASLRTDGRLPTWEETQARYPKLLTFFYSQILTGPVLLAVAIVANATLPDLPFEDSLVTWQFGIFALFAVAALIAMQFGLARCEAKRAEAMPALSDSVTSFGVRAATTLTIAVPLGVLLAALAMKDLTAMISLEVLALVLLALRARFLTRYLVDQRAPLAETDPVADAVRQVFQRAGVQPKSFIVIRSMLANAYVLPTGVVGMTSGLRWLLTPEEVAAVMAHEISHYRDRDLARFRISKAGFFVLFAGMLVGLEYLVIPQVQPQAVVAGITADMFILMQLTALASGVITRRAEFKCDAAAKAAGYGQALADALDKIGRSMGHPRAFLHFHAVFLTHPSYAARIQRLREQPAERKK